MSENCNHDCGSCSAECGERKNQPIMKKKCNPHTHIGKVIGVVSGKGGVGKSMVTSLLAVLLQKAGKKVAVLDADITGPSIPAAFGLHTRVTGTPAGIEPAVTKTGIKVMSINLLLPHETDPVVWRGPLIGGVIEQFWTDVNYGDIDYMLVDMPPGTGDVALTVFQSLPVDGIVIVASPQELVGMIVEKAVNMASMMKVPVLGMVENFSYFRCPDCGGEHEVFGPSRVKETAEKFGVEHVSRMPVDPALATAVDKGELENLAPEYLAEIRDTLLALD